MFMRMLAILAIDDDEVGNNVTDDVNDRCGNHVVDFEIADAIDVDDGANALGDDDGPWG